MLILTVFHCISLYMLPSVTSRWPRDKESTCNARVAHLQVQFLGWKDPLEEDGNPLQCSCQENPMDRGAWQIAVHRVTEESAMIKATEHKQKVVTGFLAHCFLLAVSLD